MKIKDFELLNFLFKILAHQTAFMKVPVHNTLRYPKRLIVPHSRLNMHADGRFVM